MNTVLESYMEFSTETISPDNPTSSALELITILNMLLVKAENLDTRAEEVLNPICRQEPYLGSEEMKEDPLNRNRAPLFCECITKLKKIKKHLDNIEYRLGLVDI